MKLNLKSNFNIMDAENFVESAKQVLPNTGRRLGEVSV